MLKSALLGRELDTLAPDHGVIQVFQQSLYIMIIVSLLCYLMNLQDSRLDCDSVPSLSEDEWIPEVWQTPLLLSVNTHQAKERPQLLKEDVDAQLHVDTQGSVALLLDQS